MKDARLEIKKGIKTGIDALITLSILGVMIGMASTDKFWPSFYSYCTGHLVYTLYYFYKLYRINLKEFNDAEDKKDLEQYNRYNNDNNDNGFN